MTTSKRGFTDKLGLVLRSMMMKNFFSLANKGGKAKGKKSSCGGELSSKGEKKKKDLSKIKCFCATSLGIMLLNALIGRRVPRRTK